ncbi:hypothetical protein L4D76_23705 [Photobacterium sagamiensis]|uniref:hypothetical protein n=1 Tax=Photobacterium sagamiensis TaxID=2910241 RepID=UPI003D0BA03B
MESTDDQMHVILSPSVIRWAGGESLAENWYLTQPIPQLGNLTAEEAVHQGKSALVISYLEQIMLNGYA